MDIVLFGALCRPGTERQTAYELLALAVREVFSLDTLPEIAREEGGKPFFPGAPRICFNLSHSHGAAVCALHDRPIGVDVEKLRPAPRRLVAGMPDDAFFRRWTAREATVKLQGRSWQALLSDWEPDSRCRWEEALLPGWIIAVCPTEESPIRVKRIGTEELDSVGGQA